MPTDLVISSTLFICFIDFSEGSKNMKRSFISEVNGVVWNCTNSSGPSNLEGNTTATEADFTTGFAYPATFIEVI